MKRALLLLALLFCIASFVAPAFAMKNEPEGFRGIPWGTPAPKNNFFGKNKLGLVFDSLKSLPHESTMAYYKINEDLTLGGATLTNIEYNFVEGLGFASVRISFEGEENLRLIRKACVDSWGEPFKENFDKTYLQTSIFWRGNKVFVSILYGHGDPITAQGHLRISLRAYYDAIEKAYEMYKQKKRGF